MNTQQTSRKRGPRSRWAYALLKHGLLAVLAIVCAGLFMMTLLDNTIMPALLKSGTETSAPDLIGKSLDEARRLAAGNDLQLMEVDSEYHFQYAANTISFQYPGPGTKVKPGRRIQVRVSLGTRPVQMPNVVGRSRRDAELVLNPYNLIIDRFEWVHSNEYVRGIVARQEPASDLQIPENARIVLYISDGIPEMTAIMPRLIDLGLSTALDSLRYYHFNLQKVKTHLERAPQLLPETIIDQHPDPGAPTYPETDIDLIISTQ